MYILGRKNEKDIMFHYLFNFLEGIRKYFCIFKSINNVQVFYEEKFYYLYKFI